ncbi:coiled-coil domain-containing protein [Thermophilibacter sp.]
MTTHQRTRRSARPVVAGAVVAELLAALAGAPAVARADALSDLQQAQGELSQATSDYEAAQGRVDELQAQIDQNEAHLDELEAQLPDARERAAASMRTLYKMQQGSGGLIELLLSSEDFSQLIATIQYLDIIQADNAGALDELLSLQDELELTRVSLQSQMQEAEDERAAAQEALAQANAARASLQAQIEAQAAAEAAERQAAVEAAQQDAGSSFTTESGNQAQVEVPVSEDPGTVDTGSDKDAFVAEWSARIDAYLAGSPLAGQGATFAEAAWAYGVDPRFSPAIAQVESSKGRYCFLPHNAWGWGSSSWGSWEEAIWDHVAGLAAGYGGQLTYAGAQKYCPPNASSWYSTVLANMQMI